MISPTFLGANNVENLLRRIGLYGFMGIGAAFVIMTGGIDLSIGSMICLVGCLTPWMVTTLGIPIPLVVLLLLVFSLVAGGFHGWLVSRLNLQPFLVTLCGLFIYRGITRGILADSTVGFGVEGTAWSYLVKERIPLTDDFGVPIPLLLLILVAVGSGFLLRKTVWGRHLLAIGSNEVAARHCGIEVERIKIAAYMICGFLAGLTGVLFVLDQGSGQPSNFGNFYELYAIAAAVLGGCSLRGGEGTILGVLIGVALVQVLRTSINHIDAIPNSTEFMVIGLVILLAVIVDGSIRRKREG